MAVSETRLDLKNNRNGTNEEGRDARRTSRAALAMRQRSRTGAPAPAERAAQPEAQSPESLFESLRKHATTHLALFTHEVRESVEVASRDAAIAVVAAGALAFGYLLLNAALVAAVAALGGGIPGFVLALFTLAGLHIIGGGLFLTRSVGRLKKQSFGASSTRKELEKDAKWFRSIKGQKALPAPDTTPPEEAETL
jgi:hypothetical protein